MATNVNECFKRAAETSLGIAKGLINVRNVICSLMAFGSRIEYHASKNNLFDHWEQRSMILTSSRSNSWLFFMQCWANEEFLSPVKIVLLCSPVLDILRLSMFDRYRLCHSLYNWFYRSLLIFRIFYFLSLPSLTTTMVFLNWIRIYF